MQQLFICPEGHRSEIDNSPNGLEPADPLCPVCGKTTQSVAFQEIPSKEANKRSPNAPAESTAFQDLSKRPAGSDSTAFKELEPRTSRPDRATSFTLRFPGLRREEVVRPLPQIPGFELLEELGQGPNGAVYKAREAESQRVVAVKTMQAEKYKAAAPLARLRGDLEAVGKMQHPCVIRIHAVRDFEAKPLLVMEYIDGGNLHQKIGGLPQPLTQAAQLVETLARTIQYVHEQGQCHGNLKPKNVLLTSDGLPKISDFGMARPPEMSRIKGRNTPLGGNPCYMPPEQLANLPAGTTPAADVYALGAILYELVTGRPPFQAGTEAESVALREKDEPIRPRRLQVQMPVPLETIILKALERKPGNRYASAGAMAEDLRRFLIGEPIDAVPVSSLERGWRWSLRYPLKAAGYTVASLVLTAILVIGLWSRSHLQAAVGKLDSERSSAEATIESNRRYLVLTDLELAQEAWARGDSARTLQLMEKHWQDDFGSFQWNYLWRLSHSDRLTLRGHSGPVYAVAFAPSAKTLATAGAIGDDMKSVGEIRLWDSTDGSLLTTLEGHAAPVLALAYSRFDQTLASGDKNGVLRLWDNLPAKERLTRALGRSAIRALAFSHEGQHLAVGDAEGNVRVLQVANGKEVKIFRGHTGGVSALAYSPDDSLLAVGNLGSGVSKPGEVRIWSLATGKEQMVLQGHRGAVFAVFFAPDGTSLVSAGEAVDGMGEVKWWNLNTQQLRNDLPGYFDGVRAVAFSPHKESNLLATAALDGTIKFWSLEPTPQLRAVLRGHTGEATGLAFSPDGETLATCGLDKTVKVWNVSQAIGETTLHGHSQAVHALAFAPDSTTLATVGGDGGRPGEVRIWDTRREKEQAILYGGHQQAVLAVALAVSPDGSSLTLATAGQDTQVRLWDLSSGKITSTIDGHTQWVHALAFMPRNRVLASGAADGRVILWETRSGKALGTLEGKGQTIFGLAFSPDGAALAAAEGGGIVRIWDANARVERRQLRGHTGNVTAVAYSPDGQLLATAGVDQTVRLWNAETGEETATLRGHTYWVTSVAFSPDGQTIASGSRDETIRLWDRATGYPRAVLTGHGGWVTAVAFSPDGAMLASAGYDHLVKLWHADTPEQRH